MSRKTIQLTGPSTLKMAMRNAGAEAEADLHFDGLRLQWRVGEQVQATWPAMSGVNNDHIQRHPLWYQEVADTGPLPEGVYTANQADYDWMDPVTLRTDALGISQRWPGGERSWGRHRVWLYPTNGTNTYGRSGFTIHGGEELGSIGCIDLGHNIDAFAEMFQDHGKDMLVTVHYRLRALPQRRG